MQQIVYHLTLIPYVFSKDKMSMDKSVLLINVLSFQILNHHPHSIPTPQPLIPKEFHIKVGINPLCFGILNALIENTISEIIKANWKFHASCQHLVENLCKNYFPLNGNCV